MKALKQCKVVKVVSLAASLNIHTLIQFQIHFDVIKAKLTQFLCIPCVKVGYFFTQLWLQH